MSEKTKLVIGLIALVVTLLYAVTIIGYQRDLSHSQATVKRIKADNEILAGRLAGSLAANRDLRSELDRIAAANQAAAAGIKRSIEAATDIDGIIDAIIYSINELEKALTKPGNNF